MNIGVMAMPRSPVHDHYEPQTEHSYEENESVDATMLPPGQKDKEKERVYYICL